MNKNNPWFRFRPRPGRCFVTGLVFFLGFCLPHFALFAKPTTDPTPDPPLIAVAPDPGAWSIEVKQKKTRPAPSSDPKQAATYKRLKDIYPLLVREVVEKVGKEWHREKFFDNNTMENVWVYKGFVIFQYHHFQPNVVTVLPIHDPLSPVKEDFSPNFSELSWIRPEVFVKTVTYQGQRCHYYEDKEASQLKEGDALNPVDSKGVSAWINVKTRLPVAVEDAAVIKKYTYTKKIPESIQLSGVYSAAYENAVRNAGRSGTPSTQE